MFTSSIIDITGKISKDCLFDLCGSDYSPSCACEDGCSCEDHCGCDDSNLSCSCEDHCGCDDSCGCEDS